MTGPDKTEKLLTDEENQNKQINSALGTKKGKFLFNVFISKLTNIFCLYFWHFPHCFENMGVSPPLKLFGRTLGQP